MEVRGAGVVERLTSPFQWLAIDFGTLTSVLGAAFELSFALTLALFVSVWSMASSSACPVALDRASLTSFLLPFLPASLAVLGLLQTPDLPTDGRRLPPLACEAPWRPIPRRSRRQKGEASQDAVHAVAWFASEREGDGTLVFLTAHRERPMQVNLFSPFEASASPSSSPPPPRTAVYRSIIDTLEALQEPYYFAAVNQFHVPPLSSLLPTASVFPCTRWAFCSLSSLVDKVPSLPESYDLGPLEKDDLGQVRERNGIAFPESYLLERLDLGSAVRLKGTGELVGWVTVHNDRVFLPPVHPPCDPTDLFDQSALAPSSSLPRTDPLPLLSPSTWSCARSNSSRDFCFPPPTRTSIGCAPIRRRGTWRANGSCGTSSVGRRRTIAVGSCYTRFPDDEHCMRYKRPSALKDRVSCRGGGRVGRRVR